MTSYAQERNPDKMMIGMVNNINESKVSISPKSKTHGQ